MKRIITILIALALILSLAGCSSASYDLSFNTGETDWYEMNEAVMEAPQAKASGRMFDSAYADEGGSVPAEEVKAPTSRKLIRNLTLTVETLEFEDFIGTLSQKVKTFGGYIESSNINGDSYNYKTDRYANFTCRIPANKLDEFVNTVDGLGNVTYRNENQQDVTLNYVDTEARIGSLQTEYDRLLELLAEAENLDSIIMLENRLSEVRYQLESYKSQIRTYDNLVDYSTVYVNVNEVERETPVLETKTIGERIATGFSTNLYEVKTDLEDFFVFAVSSVPYFILPAAIAVLIVLIIVFGRKAAKKDMIKKLKAEKAKKQPTEIENKK